MINLTIAQIKTELKETVYSNETYKRIFNLNNELRDRLLPTEEVEYNVQGYEERQVDPAEFEVGDLMASHGYICKVDEILRFPNDRDQEYYGDTFVFLCTYVCGDLDGVGGFNYFIESTNNGCDRGYRSHEQGNRLAKWHKLFKI